MCWEPKDAPDALPIFTSFSKCFQEEKLRFDFFVMPDFDYNMLCVWVVCVRIESVGEEL